MQKFLRNRAETSHRLRPIPQNALRPSNQCNGQRHLRKTKTGSDARRNPMAPIRPRKTHQQRIHQGSRSRKRNRKRRNLQRRFKRAELPNQTPSRPAKRNLCARLIDRRRIYNPDEFSKKLKFAAIGLGQ